MTHPGVPTRLGNRRWVVARPCPPSRTWPHGFSSWRLLLAHRELLNVILPNAPAIDIAASAASIISIADLAHERGMARCHRSAHAASLCNDPSPALSRLWIVMIECVRKAASPQAAWPPISCARARKAGKLRCAQTRASPAAGSAGGHSGLCECNASALYTVLGITSTSTDAGDI